MTAVVSKFLLALATVVTLLVVAPPSANAATCPAWTVMKRTSTSLTATLPNGSTTRRTWTLTVRKKGSSYVACFGNKSESGYAKIQWRPGRAGVPDDTFWYTDNMAVVQGPPAYVRGIGKYRGQVKYSAWLKVR
ncbi:hypothetical protein ASG49_03845 [Marmoricola sp. Leaf446]|uniref:hypothetical protein n=1 Tax=Marmoricola sp. Leaf446 TaxID=1736379 RepID=UPI0006FD595D|nr:hypothetical protein [Marmoricola sp. Leaf446]KQT94062.1 hypothetical protein ASG49_03845 [Marmoricola sp. Leaf446]